MAGTSTSGFADAVEAAQSADATIIVIGLDQTQEAEGNDRTFISLPGVQVLISLFFMLHLSE
jgi:hypothetical protein